MKSKGGVIGPALFYALFWALFFAPVWVSGRLLAPGDAWLQSVPAYLAGWHTWTPYLFGGFPVAADPSTMSAYPLLALFQLLGVPWNLFVISAYLIASCTAHCWIRELTRSATAGWVAGLTYAMSGFMIVHLQHISLIHAAAWIPCMLWGVERLRRGDSYPGFVGLALGAAMVWSAGHPQIALYGSGLVAAYAVAAFLAARPTRRRSMLGWSLAATGAMLLLTGLFWVPVLELARSSGREAITLHYFLSYSLLPRDLIQLLFPMIWGGNVASFYHIPYFGGETHAGQGFVGYLPWLLIPLAWWRHPSRRQLLFWSLVAVVAVMLALGGSTPVGRWMFHLPGYNMFRVPARNLMEFTLAMVALSGFGIAALERVVREQRRRLAGRAVALLAVGFAAAVAALQLVQPQIAAAARKWMHIEGWSAGLGNPAVSVPLLSLLVVAALFLAAAYFSRERLLFPVAVVVGLFGYTGFCGWRYDAPRNSGMPPSLDVVGHDANWRVLGAGRAWDSKNDSNWPRVWRLQAADGYDPLVLSDYRKILGMTPFGDLDDQLFEPENRALDILAVRYIYAVKSQLASLRSQPGRFARLAGPVWINRRALPRARLVGETRPLSKGEALRAIHTGRLPDGTAFDPGRCALVGEHRPAAAYDMRGSARLLKAGRDEVVIGVKSGGRALLLLADTFYPGWRAEVDGRRVPLIRADLTARAVEVPAGDHRVRFFFVPRSLYIGAALSAAGVLLMVSIEAWRRRRRRASAVGRG